ncbi:MAG TPA: TniB family NTP-binding protein [Rhodanobacter sp.]|nr:TniB family NTP-binding protein [Rhodanobacter sp.]
MSHTPDFESYRDLLSRIRIPHPAFELAGCELMHAYRGVGYSDFPRYLQLSGPSRAGKTCLVTDFMKTAPAIQRQEGLHRPIVYAPIPPKGTTMGVIENLLRALGDPHWARGTETNKLSRLLLQLSECGCRMIVLDEFQHLVDKGQNKTLKRTVDFIKALAEPNRWALVASGLSEAQAAIDGDAQLSGRFDAPLEIARFEWTDAVLHKQYRGVLAAFEEALAPFELPSLEGEELALRFYLATGGLMGLIVKLLQRVIEDAIDEERLTIRMPHLNDAFRRAIRFASRLRDGDGPFEMKLFGAPLEERRGEAVRMATALDDDPPVAPSPTSDSKAPKQSRKTIGDHKREMAEAL